MNTYRHTAETTSTKVHSSRLAGFLHPVFATGTPDGDVYASVAHLLAHDDLTIGKCEKRSPIGHLVETEKSSP